MFYENDGPGARVLGGGWIERAEHAADAEIALRRIVDAPVVAAIA